MALARRMEETLPVAVSKRFQFEASQVLIKGRQEAVPPGGCTSSTVGDRRSRVSDCRMQCSPRTRQAVQSACMQCSLFVHLVCFGL
jgi:hypothetical protein